MMRERSRGDAVVRNDGRPQLARERVEHQHREVVEPVPRDVDARPPRCGLFRGRERLTKEDFRGRRDGEMHAEERGVAPEQERVGPQRRIGLVSGRDTLEPTLPYRPANDPNGDHDLTRPVAPQQPIEPQSNLAVRVYAFAQYLLLFVAVFAFTFVADKISLGMRLAMAVWLCASLAVVGALLDARRWALRVEPLRWAILLGAAGVRICATLSSGCRSDNDEEEPRRPSPFR